MFYRTNKEENFSQGRYSIPLTCCCCCCCLGGFFFFFLGGGVISFTEALSIHFLLVADYVTFCNSTYHFPGNLIPRELHNITTSQQSQAMNGIGSFSCITSAGRMHVTCLPDLFDLFLKMTFKEPYRNQCTLNRYVLNTCFLQSGDPSWSSWKHDDI